MPIFTISYELRGQAKGFNYTAFGQELQKQKCFQLQGTMWLGSFQNNATQIHNHFRKLMDPSDSLMVTELFQHFCYTGGSTGVTRWLELNKPTAIPGAKPEETLEAGIARSRQQQASRGKAAGTAAPAPAKAPAAAKAPAKAPAKPSSAKSAAKPAAKAGAGKSKK